MWQIFPFLICVRPHRHVWQAGLNVEWDDVAVDYLDSLLTARNLDQLVIDIMVEGFEL